MQFPITVPALKVTQPMGDFFAVSLPAELLLEVCFSDRMRAEKTLLGYELKGTQRDKKDSRLQQIAEYIDREDSAFPNAIILAANFHTSGFTIDEFLELNSDDDSSLNKNELDVEKNKLSNARWAIDHIADDKNSFNYTLTIPSKEKLAAVIDGQHRLFSFTSNYLKNPERLEMHLLCSIYLDLPKAYQADLFATINSTQKPVDKSLTYELYGYNISEEKSENWTPDKLAVFFTRKLATLDESPLKGKIKIAPKTDDALSAILEEGKWSISTAVVVEGIMKLFSTNPTRDSNFLLSHKNSKREILRHSQRRDSSILREYYLAGNDNFIYTIILNYLNSCEKIFWTNANPNSFIIKTVGVQAIFDILRKILPEALAEKDISLNFFTKKLEPAKELTFTEDKFKNASGSGRSIIRKAIEDKIL